MGNDLICRFQKQNAHNEIVKKQKFVVNVKLCKNWC